MKSGRDENISPETSTIDRQPRFYWRFLLVDVDHWRFLLVDVDQTELLLLVDVNVFLVDVDQ